jgi:hypothetical protein
MERAICVWKETILHAFIGGTDGTFPSGLILDAHGHAFLGPLSRAALQVRA